MQSRSRPPLSMKVRPRAGTFICPYCRDVIEGSQAQQICPDCGTRQHADCQELGHDCAVFCCHGGEPCVDGGVRTVETPAADPIFSVVVALFLPVVLLNFAPVLLILLVPLVLVALFVLLQLALSFVPSLLGSFMKRVKRCSERS